MKRLDRYIFFRLMAITFFVLIVLIFIFILIDFSENSDDFADKGATLTQIWTEYYLNYIPEMIRLVSPVAIFIAVLFLTAQMTERLEITALKAAGVSLYRLSIPYFAFGISMALLIGWLDSSIIPNSNAERIQFEQEFIGGSSETIDRGSIYRQESPDRIFHLTHFNHNSNTGYRLTLIRYNSNHEIEQLTTASRIDWVDSLSTWKGQRIQDRIYMEEGFRDSTINEGTLDINILPRDLARRTSDIYQLTWVEAAEYIESIERIGAGEINLPSVQLFGRILYPISILVVTLIGFALASQKRKGGIGFYIAAGLTFIFIYLAIMKIMEPLGAAGTLEPMSAAAIPHILFFLIGLFMFLLTRK